MMTHRCTYTSKCSMAHVVPLALRTQQPVIYQLIIIDLFLLWLQCPNAQILLDSDDQLLWFTSGFTRISVLISWPLVLSFSWLICGIATSLVISIYQFLKHGSLPAYHPSILTSFVFINLCKSVAGILATSQLITPPIISVNHYNQYHQFLTIIWLGSSSLTSSLAMVEQLISHNFWLMLPSKLCTLGPLCLRTLCGRRFWWWLTQAGINHDKRVKRVHELLIP